VRLPVITLGVGRELEHDRCLGTNPTHFVGERAGSPIMGSGALG